MSKSLAAAAAFSTFFVLAPAFAAPPADQEACNALAFSFAEKAAGGNLPETKAVKVDELIAKLEGQCADNKFADAEATSKEIEAALK
jgi:hypothetical protein